MPATSRPPTTQSNPCRAPATPSTACSDPGGGGTPLRTIGGDVAAVHAEQGVLLGVAEIGVGADGGLGVGPGRAAGTGRATGLLVSEKAGLSEQGLGRDVQRPGDG